MAGFRKAKGEQAMLKMGFYGPPGSGKTFTALLCAEGLAKAQGKRVAYVDTERGTDFYCQEVQSRKVHPEAFDFDASYTRSIVEITKDIRALNPAQHGVVVIDSMTHLWEAARNAYTGKRGPGGQIPLSAWSVIKKPYKDLLNYLLSADMHLIICGRQGDQFEEDEEGDLKKVGVKMKAEGETPYEPHILIRMECIRNNAGVGTIHAFAEKDRTGVLQGHTIKNPTFDTLCRPLLPLLSGTQAKITPEDEVATADGEALAQQERDRAVRSESLRKEFAAKFQLCKTKGELDAESKKMTAEIKKEMSATHVTELREMYQELGRELPA